MLDITHADKLLPVHLNDIRKFQLESARRVGEHKLPEQELVFHYTSGEGLLGIVEKKTLRATHIGYMSDGSEYIHAVNSLATQFEIALDGMSEGYMREYFSFLLGQLTATQLEDYPLLFVSCFTTVEDSVEHWKTYGKDNGGYCIAFNRNRLEQHVLSTGKALLVPVRYDAIHQKKIFAYVTEWITSIYPKHFEDIIKMPEKDRKAYTEMWAAAVFSALAPLAAIFKASSFASESEYRVIYRTGDFSEITFEPKPNMLRGYVKIGIDPASVHSIRVGPGQHQRLNMASALALKQKLKLENIHIRMSAHRLSD